MDLVSISYFFVFRDSFLVRWTWDDRMEALEEFLLDILESDKRRDIETLDS